MAKVRKKECLHCHYKNKLHATKCYNCGRPLPTESEYATQQLKLGCLGILLIPVLYFLYGAVVWVLDKLF